MNIYIVVLGAYEYVHIHSAKKTKHPLSVKKKTIMFMRAISRQSRSIYLRECLAICAPHKTHIVPYSELKTRKFYKTRSRPACTSVCAILVVYFVFFLCRRGRQIYILYTHPGNKVPRASTDTHSRHLSAKRRRRRTSIYIQPNNEWGHIYIYMCDRSLVVIEDAGREGRGRIFIYARVCFVCGVVWGWWFVGGFKTNRLL